MEDMEAQLALMLERKDMDPCLDMDNLPIIKALTAGCRPGQITMRTCEVFYGNGNRQVKIWIKSILMSIPQLGLQLRKLNQYTPPTADEATESLIGQDLAQQLMASNLKNLIKKTGEWHKELCELRHTVEFTRARLDSFAKRERMHNLIVQNEDPEREHDIERALTSTSYGKGPNLEKSRAERVFLDILPESYKR
ncbi:MAG: hypothetical protein Q9226_009006 [Calogaya cf. arnoldii]